VYNFYINAAVSLIDSVQSFVKAGFKGVIIMMKRIPTKLLASVVPVCTFTFCLSSSLLLPSQSASAQQPTQQGDSSQLVAVTIPNFRPGATYNNGTLEVSIPQALLAGAIDQILRANEGRIKDTEFQKVDIRNMRFSLVQERFDPCGNRPNCIPSGTERTESGFRVEGQWQFQFRERLVRNPFTGNWTHTPWTSVSGSFSQPLYFRVNNSRLDLQPGGLTLRGDRWYADAVAPIATLFGVQGQIKENLRNAIQDINGMDLRQILIEYGSSEVENRAGIGRQVVSQLIDQNLGGIGAQVSGGNLVVSISLPNVFPVTGIPIPVNFGNTLFYDRNSGVCAFTASDSQVIQRLTTCRRTWHSIVYTADKLLFYDRDAGQIETYRVGNQGLGEQLHSYAPGSMRRTWMQITSPEPGIIVFRDDNGQVETYRLNNIGMLQGL
jgi:hypothetical protein